MRIFIAIISIFIMAQTGATVSQDYSVQVSAVIQKFPHQIRLVWPADPDATGYQVYRKTPAATSWGPPITLPRTATSYTHTNVSLGTKYEYWVRKTGYEASTTTPYTGHGYLVSGIEISATENRGKLTLIVDNTYSADLVTELNRFEEDLMGDGWIVLRRNVARTATVATVKSVIRAAYNTDPANMEAVLLFGHVPVPYSGNTAFDQHDDVHTGAWPADVFYGEMNGAWTDTAVRNTSAERIDNHNRPGDGKYDQSFLPSDVELQVGRIDLADMPAFPKSERELLRQYLNKDHNFRHKLISVQSRGLIDDQFGLYAGDIFAATGWRNFSAFFGAGNIDAGSGVSLQVDWFPTLAVDSYLWSQGVGGGSYTSANGIGETAPGITPLWAPGAPFLPMHNFVTTGTRAVFNMLVGSFFGDWDSQNNFLRAPLATTTYGLTSAWAGRPHWFLHHMALGETIGYSTRLTQNNDELYTNQLNRFPRGVHVALMGDPTLRMHVVAPPENLVANIVPAGVRLSWDAAPDTIRGYHVYRSFSPTGPFYRVTGALGAPLTGTSFTDTNVAFGNSFTYMVRAIKLQNSGSGSYFNLSQGIFDRITVTETASILQFSASAYSVSEGAGQIWITVNRTGDLGAVSVNYFSSDGTASSLLGLDYTAVSGTIYFAAGDTSSSFSIPINDDAFDLLAEGNETVNLTLINPSGGAALGVVYRAVLTIVNNDLPAGALQFSVSSYIVSELNSANEAIVTVTRVGSDYGAVSVRYSTSDGTAEAGTDYIAVNGVLSFANGDTNPKTFTIPIIQEARVETDETVNLRLTNPTGGATLGIRDNAILTIYNDDELLQFDAASYSVNESEGTATIDVIRTGKDTGVIGVSYSTADASATAGEDYGARSGILTFADGVTRRSFTIPIINDADVEGIERIQLTLSDPTGISITLGSPNTTMLTINDND